ncbi:hypothetical protein KAI46_05715 [bacterium]|nr:hypothetical protein [bacterium]
MGKEILREQPAPKKENNEIRERGDSMVKTQISASTSVIKQGKPKPAPQQPPPKK